MEGLLETLHNRETSRLSQFDQSSYAQPSGSPRGHFQSVADTELGIASLGRQDGASEIVQVRSPDDNESLAVHDGRVSGQPCQLHHRHLHQAQQNRPQSTQPPLAPAPPPSSLDAKDLVDEILWSSNTANTFRDESSGLMIGEHGQEYAGSSCGMLLLSDPGLQWILQTTEDNVSLERLREMVNNILLQLKLPTRGSAEGLGIRPNRLKSNLPDISTAKKYIDVYFARQWLWPIIREARFRDQCEKYWSDPSGHDTTWYALYNVILALGCRACISCGTPKSFLESEKEAWAYFDNTISVQSDLMYQKTSLQAVQTFALMTVFAQGVGGPQPEYIYCAIAVRLATGLGLHKYAPKKWNLSDLEIEDRNRVFWGLYCLDKTIAFRTGRPSLLDDSDIACTFPRHVFEHHGPEEANISKVEFDFFLSVTQYSRLCSRIIKHLYSTTSLLQTPEARYRTVRDLYDELRRWREATKKTGQSDFGSWTTLRETKLNSNVLFYQRLVLDYFYHDSVISLDKACWLQNALPSNKHSSGRVQMASQDPLAQLASDALESARTMCLLTQQIDIESYTPNWLVIYYPLTAIITLFSHVLRNPLSPSAMSDVALIQCVNGLFGRIEYISSGNILLTRSGEFAKLASSLIEKAKNNGVNHANDSPLPFSESLDREQATGGTRDVNDGAHVNVTNRTTISTPSLPFLQPPAANSPTEASFAPYMTDQYQSLNWLDWNFLQGDMILAPSP